MKLFSIAAATLSLISFVSISQAALLVDRIFDPNAVAEGIPLKVTYKIYNTYNE